ncbi:MAG TPA: TIM-barrel domain-containing protein, partial [Polyangia bacterium]
MSEISTAKPLTKLPKDARSESDIEFPTADLIEGTLARPCQKTWQRFPSRDAEQRDKIDGLGSSWQRTTVMKMRFLVSGVAGNALAVALAVAAGCASPKGTTASGAGGNAGGGSGAGGSTGSGGNGSAGSGGSTNSGSGGAANAGDAGEDAPMDTSLPPLVCPAAPPAAGPFSIDATGITFSGTTGILRVQVCQADVVRVAYTTAAAIPMKTSLAVNATWPTPTFCVSETGGIVTITTARMQVNVATATGLVTFADSAGNGLLSEASKSLTPATVEGVGTNTVATAWKSPADEALFGLGQHQDGVINRKGSTLDMRQANTQIQIPLVVSNKGYGVLWDNPSNTTFSGNAAGNTQYSFSSEAGDIVDYYYFYGPTIDRVIGLYRTATGAAPLFPKWAYGLFQSKDHYTSSADLLAVDHGYRSNNIPVDVIVQDWQYWTPAVWGSQLMDPSRYPDPAATVSQLHTDNIHTMISIWPQY